MSFIRRHWASGLSLILLVALLAAIVVVILYTPTEQSRAAQPDPPASTVEPAPGPCPVGIDLGTRLVYGDSNPQPEFRLCWVEGIAVNASIAEQTRNVVSWAREEGIDLSGKGYRGPLDDPARWRRQTGCTELPSSDASSPCSLNAPRGRISAHELGLGVDWLLEGRRITPADPEYGPLQQALASQGFVTPTRYEPHHSEVRP